MDSKTETLNFLGEKIRKKYLRKFEETDPFNPENTVSGWICNSANRKYGALLIEKINNEPSPQFIWSIPKMGYPFDRQKNEWHFPQKSKKIEVFEKLDGTGILQYQYQYKGKKFTSYKTRLTPFLRSGRFGDFFEMWNEMLRKFPDIKKLPELNPDFNIAFELYGKRNKIIVEYDDSLTCAVLFGVSNEGKIVIPQNLNLLKVPMVQHLKTVNPNENLIEAYNEMREWQNNHIRVDKELDKEIIRGIEGSVWYFVDEHDAIQEKCKPDIIQDIHFKASEGIPPHSIYTTCINAFEEHDEINFDIIKQMLLEEFQESEIYKREIRIKKIIADVMVEKKLKTKIFEDYEKLGIDINKDRGGVMRWFSQKYGKDSCRKIFRILWDNYHPVARKPTSFRSGMNCNRKL